MKKLKKFTSKWKLKDLENWILKYEIFYVGTKNVNIMQKFALLIDILRQALLIFILVGIQYDVFI